MKHLSAAFLVAVCFAPTAAKAVCDPIEFQVQDYEHLTRDDVFAASFFSHLSQSQFDTVKKNFATSGKYAKLFEGDVNYDEYKRRVERMISTQDIRINSSSALNYVSQRLSPVAQESYSLCLERDPGVLGLNIWLSKPRQGSYYTLKARWVGGENDAGTLTSKVEDGTKIISELPQSWSRAYTYEITVKKESCASDGALILRVNNDSKNYVLLGDAPTPQFATETIRYTKIAGTASGGNWAPDKAVDTQCISPTKPGARLDPSSAYFVDVKRSEEGRTSVKWTSQTPDSVCWEVSAWTGAKEHAVTVSAGAAVNQLVPLGPRACDKLQ
ncbi:MULTISPECIES: hypothetical protein [Bradyrhizobium]|uniref:hypothetical protein n=1 Tax=Bradyrhizobium TaxID=374 RepID=UPI00155DFF1E|nr:MULTISPECIES: hypothetical protein [Bradyrhizobium]MDD1523610.1 hypothetical protein [Bradyrhizobium sp. WBAH30]MDD1547688.1 hypothetical protein [Bradyrhizobium sp. WBAH41]MDD1561339.1 hypothetical protein [Bradyrhizobium sp. WBAH23]MDD1568778.1 hypothetical protein [Bradyrhizobium sp. WBAH33]MDD1594739.1 hypothetical protein [Bradyrhizobium sp. WBAH42]